MIYTIFKNWHYSLPPIIPIYYNKNIVEYDIILANNIWHEQRNSDDNDISKIVGVCYGIFGMRKNSIRIGFKRSIHKNIIDIYLYLHENSKKHTAIFLQNKYIEEDNNKLTIKLYGLQQSQLSVYIDNHRVFQRYNDVKKQKLMFGAKPYEGGDNKAKQTYKTIIKYVR